MRGYTSIEQSKKLLELGLPAESADMFWRYNHNIHTYDNIPKILVVNNWDDYYNKNIPAWSLTALLGVLPKICYPVKDHSTYLTLCKLKDKWCAIYLDVTGIQDGEQTLADNPVDACYELILKLHELKML